jgi:hypothetical protein
MEPCRDDDQIYRPLAKDLISDVDTVWGLGIPNLRHIAHSP